MATAKQQTFEGPAIGRRFTRTRPEEARFRRSLAERDLTRGCPSERLATLAESLLGEVATVEQWREAVRAAALGWNLTVLPAEMATAWMDDPELTPELLRSAYAVMRAKATLFPDDKRIISDWVCEPIEHGVEISVTTLSYS